MDVKWSENPLDFLGLFGPPIQGGFELGGRNVGFSALLTSTRLSKRLYLGSKKCPVFLGRGHFLG